MDYTLDRGNARLTAAGCKKSSEQMLSIHDWLADIDINCKSCQYVEVQFKNTLPDIGLRSGEQLFAGQKLIHRDGEKGRDGFQGVDIGVASAGFPLGHGCPGNIKRLGKGFLGQPFFFAQRL